MNFGELFRYLLDELAVDQALEREYKMMTAQWLIDQWNQVSMQDFFWRIYQDGEGTKRNKAVFDGECDGDVSGSGGEGVERGDGDGDNTDKDPDYRICCRYPRCPICH